jgi:5-methylcytosine-specific restriction protein A
VTFIIAIIALIISILAYQKAGGAKELEKTIDVLSSAVESLKDRTGGSLKEQIGKLTSVTESFRDRTADTIDRLEKALRRKPGGKSPEVRPPKTPEDFQSELNGMFASAQQQGKSFIEIKSGDLHQSLSGYPGHNHRLPSCCIVMKRNMKPGDQILQQPPSGAGATLIIRFKLPR